MTDSTAPFRLSWPRRVGLLLRVWRTYLSAALALRRRGLQGAVAHSGARRPGPTYPVSLVSRAVSRGLRVGPLQPRCLHRAMVLYTLLRDQGVAAELVIGLPTHGTSTDAHAWVEVAGRDVGPHPGSLGAAELTRFPRDLGAGRVAERAG